MSLLNRLLENDRVVRIVAVAIALILWAYANNGQSQGQQVVTAVPVEVRNLPADTVVTQVNPASVNVTLGGDTLARQRLSANADLQAQIDLSGLGPGRHQIRIDTVPVPRGVTLIAITPASVVVTMEALERRSIEVSLVTVGVPASGFVVDSLQARPGQIEVSGPSSVVWRVARVEGSLRIDGSNTGFRQTVTLSAVDADGASVSGVRLQPDQVDAQVTITPAPMSKSLPVEVPVTGQPAKGYHVVSVTVVPAQVTVSGPPELVRPLQSLRTDPVDVSGLKETLSRSVGLVLPDGVHMLNGEPVDVEVSIAADR